MEKMAFWPEAFLFSFFVDIFLLAYVSLLAFLFLLPNDTSRAFLLLEHV